MPNQTIDYPRLVEQALRHVVHDTLCFVKENGLPGQHQLYITFKTTFDGVVIGDVLSARYPNEMMIVLQHEFWDLEVSNSQFEVTLSFNDVLHRLVVPYNAITVFADPSVKFGLQFELDDQDVEDSTSETSDADQGVEKTDAEEDEKPARDADVVTLDHFRNKK